LWQAVTEQPIVVMGRVAGAFGIKGWIKVQPFTQSTDGLLQYSTWWLQRVGSWDENRVEDAAVHRNTVIAKLTGIESREAAAALRGCEIGVPRDELPANNEGEYYWSDLVGLVVANREGEPLGRVVQLLETGSQQVLVVQGERERLIPFVEPVVVSVDLAGGSLVVDWGKDF